MKKILTALTLLFITFAGCNNDDDSTPQNPVSQLPPPTQSGKNTFGYLLNEQPVIITNTTKITAIYQSGLLQLGGGVENNDIDVDIRIILQDPLQENIPYSLTNFPVHRARYIDYNQMTECEYSYEDTYQGTITFSNIDEVNYVISGTFNFSTVTTDCNDIKITEGRFDVQYIP